LFAANGSVIHMIPCLGSSFFFFFFSANNDKKILWVTFKFFCGHAWAGEDYSPVYIPFTLFRLFTNNYAFGAYRPYSYTPLPPPPDVIKIRSVGRAHKSMRRTKAYTVPIVLDVLKLFIDSSVRSYRTCGAAGNGLRREWNAN
jgi:hypothetical protein